MAGRRTPSLPGPDEHVFSVSELNHSVGGVLQDTWPLIWLEAEISNFRHVQASGHWYMTLKDENAQVSAAMFRGQNRQVKFTPRDGDQVLVQGQVSLYEARGTYQVILRHMEERGAGALHAAFQRLKEKLDAEGLFAAQRKRPLPRLPRRIGVITSRDGAALRDILRILWLRHTGLSVLLIPTRVQGDGAADEIAHAISRAGQAGGLDALIVGRGGGSLEDLWAFNEEVVARALAACPIPVISAVGHESDITIADLVADDRAATPSAAAAAVVASRQDMQDHVAGFSRRLAQATRLQVARLRSGPAGRFPLLAGRLLGQRLRQSGQRADDLGNRLHNALSERLHGARHRSTLLKARLSPRSLLAVVASRRQGLAGITVNLRAVAASAVERRRQRLALASGRLQDLSPLAVLGRGYALAREAATGTLLRRADQVAVGDRVEVRLQQGSLTTEVTGVHRDPNHQ